MKKSVLDWVKSPYVILLLVDLILSNIWELWRDVRSDDPMFKSEDGWVDLWVNDLASMYSRPLLLPIAIVIWYITKIIPKQKHIWFTCIYFILLVKDQFDFVQDGNRGSALTDFVIFLVTIIVCEAISEVTQNRSHGNG